MKDYLHLMKLYSLIFTIASVISCVSIQKNNSLYNPTKISNIGFNSIQLDSKNQTVSSADLINHQDIITNFFEFNEKYRQSLSMTFLECEKNDRNTVSQFFDEIILPLITLGFYPHHNDYNCPVIINITTENKTKKKSVLYSNQNRSQSAKYIYPEAVDIRTVES